VQMLVAAAGERHALLLAVSPLSFAGSLNGIVIAGFLIIALLCVTGVYSFRKSPPQEQAVAVVAFSLLASPYALSYDIVALAPFAAAVILRDRSWRGLLGAVTYTAALGPLSLLSAILSSYPGVRGVPLIERQRSAGREFG